MRARVPLVSVATLAIVAACSDDPEVIKPSRSQPVDFDASVEVSGLPCDIDRVVRLKCQSCHSAFPELGAPMPLVTWNDFHDRTPTDVNLRVYQRVGERIQDPASPMPPASSPGLDDAERAILVEWVNTGAPRGVGDCPKE